MMVTKSKGGRKAGVMAVKIRTRRSMPPIPVRQFDWSAIEDSYEPGRPIGRGPTEHSAIDDLIEQLGDTDRAHYEVV
jgi:hypothetical protein